MAERLFAIVEQDRRALSPRLHPSGRRGDRRPAAGRDRAALSRSALRHAGDAVRLRGRGKSRPGEVRLSGPEDADRHRQGGRAAQDAAASMLDTQTIDFDDAADLRDAVARRQRGRVPAGRRGHARSVAQDEARPHQRSRGAGGALSPGSDGFDSRNTSPASAARRSRNIFIPRWSRSSTKPSA